MTLEEVTFFIPLIFQSGKLAERRDETLFCMVLFFFFSLYPTLDCSSNSRNQFLVPHSGLECFLIMSYVCAHTWVYLCVCFNLCS